MCVFWVMIWQRNLHWCFQWSPHYISSGGVPWPVCPGRMLPAHSGGAHMWMPELPMYSGEPVTTVAPSKSLVLLPGPHPQRHRSSQSSRGHCQSTPGPVQALNISGLTVKKQTKQKTKNKKKLSFLPPVSTEIISSHSNNFQLNWCTFTNHHLCNVLFHVCPLISPKSDTSGTCHVTSTYLHVSTQ